MGCMRIRTTGWSRTGIPAMALCLANVLGGACTCSDGTYMYGVILRIVKAGCHLVAIAQVVEH